MTAVSPSLAGDEEVDCRALAQEWGLRWTPVATDEMARDLAANQPPYSAQPTLMALGEMTADASPPLTLSAAVVLGQIRSLVVDLLELSGMTYSDAIGAVPNR